MDKIQGFLPLIAIIAVFYFLMIAPQMRRSKQEKKFLSELKKGDKVVTVGGIHGKVVDLNDKDNSCVIETMAGKMKFERSAISVEKSKKANAS